MGWETGSITILSGEERVGNGFGKSTRFMMLKEIKQSGISVITGATVRRIEKNQILYTAEGEERSLKADTVVIARGWEKSRLSELGREVEAGRVEVIGDARRPGRISEAVDDAFAAAIIYKEGKDV